jgi:hypothetical protein
MATTVALLSVLSLPGFALSNFRPVVVDNARFLAVRLSVLRPKAATCLRGQSASGW